MAQWQRQLLLLGSLFVAREARALDASPEASPTTEGSPSRTTEASPPRVCLAYATFLIGANNTSF
eukprot:6538098-Prymnesium_polylepis.1